MKTLPFRDRNGWRKWLTLNHRKSGEVWLIIPKKNAGGTSYRISYNEALEEAICFGWIDSRVKPLDSTRSLVRFTPRKSMNWSSYNIERAERLITQRKMTPAGIRALPEYHWAKKRKNRYTSRSARKREEKIG